MPHTFPGSLSAKPGSQSFSYSPIGMQFTTRCRGIDAGQKNLQPNLNSNFHRAPEPRRTTLEVHEDDQAWTGKSLGRIRARQTDRNLARNSSSMAELGILVGRTHIQVYRLTPSPQKLACNPKSISNKQKEETKYVRN